MKVMTKEVLDKVASVRAEVTWTKVHPDGRELELVEYVPFDRLSIPVDAGISGLPPRKSFYHTRRAQAAREAAEQRLPEHVARSQALLIDAGLGRAHKDIADVADHNVITLAHALKYAECGLPVIDSHAIDPKTGAGTSLQGSAKLPRGSAWEQRASNDPEEITNFCTGDGKYPATKSGEVHRFARVGAPRNVSITFPKGCGLFVLDLDGPDGAAWLAEIQEKHGTLPKTAHSITGSGGSHYIFRTDRPIRNTASQIAPGVDIRGEGGQIVAAPSIHKTGNFYRWEDGCAPWESGIAEAPEWLIDAALDASKKTNSKQKPSKPKPKPKAARRDTQSGGFEDILASIGDHDGGNGFDTPIFRAACSYFATNGATADAGELQEVLRIRVLEADCKDSRAVDRYATDEYLTERITQAREFIAGQETERTCGVIGLGEDDDVLIAFAKDQIQKKKDESPFLFEYGDSPAIVRKGRLIQPDCPTRRHLLNSAAKFEKSDQDSARQVLPPNHVVDDVFSADLSNVLLPLRAVVTSPFFAADGTLVVENGYHDGSQVFLESNVDVPLVSQHPTSEEARASARYLVEEVLADFPLDGKTRSEIMNESFSGAGIPAVANTVAMILLPFARELIAGATPGHVVNKPAPGTGAGYLVAVSSIIATGSEVAATPLPRNSDEVGKTLTAILENPAPIVFFDNINHAMDSAELASAITAPKEGYSARILGKSQMVKVPVRCVWTLAANTLTMSPELLRRMILIGLDRRDPAPGKWTPTNGWRHTDVRTWARENRPQLVHACLTIIRRWVVEGMRRSDHRLGSFEDWAGVMGGILNSAAIPGLMGNSKALSELADDSDDGLQSLMQAIADRVAVASSPILYVGERKQQGVQFGLFNILHGMEDTPALANWGYDDQGGEVVYNNSQKAGRAFAKVAKGVYRVEKDGEPYNLSFEDRRKKDKGYPVVLTPAAT